MGAHVPDNIRTASLSLITVLFTAWDKGNLPLNTVTLREYDLLMSFSAGVAHARDKGATAGYHHADPMDVVPNAKARSFKSMRKK